MRNLILLAALALCVACAGGSSDCQRAAEERCAHLKPQDRDLCYGHESAQCDRNDPN